MIKNLIRIGALTCAVGAVLCFSIGAGIGGVGLMIASVALALLVPAEVKP